MPKKPTEKWEKELWNLFPEEAPKGISFTEIKSFIAKTLKAQEFQLTKEHAFKCSNILRTERAKFDKVLRIRLDYCQKQNGLPYCKNCGLSEEDLAQKKIKEFFFHSHFSCPVWYLISQFK